MIRPYKPRIIRSKRSSLSLQVLPNAELVVRAPFWMPDFAVQKFIDQNRTWIEKRLEKAKSTKKLVDEISKEKIMFLGKLMSVKVGNYINIHLGKEYILFPKALEFRMKKELSIWYIQNAKEIIKENVDRYAKEMDVSYKSLSFSDTKSKWGSCTYDNRLQFNWRLVMAPLLVVNYVIVHELAHITEKNHSKDFWNTVARYNPSYRQNRRWLKEHGDLLFAQV